MKRSDSRGEHCGKENGIGPGLEVEVHEFMEKRGGDCEEGANGNPAVVAHLLGECAEEIFAPKGEKEHQKQYSEGDTDFAEEFDDVVVRVVDNGVGETSFFEWLDAGGICAKTSSRKPELCEHFEADGTDIPAFVEGDVVCGNFAETSRKFFDDPGECEDEGTGDEECQDDELLPSPPGDVVSEEESENDVDGEDADGGGEAASGKAEKLCDDKGEEGQEEQDGDAKVLLVFVRSFISCGDIVGPFSSCRE